MYSRDEEYSYQGSDLFDGTDLYEADEDETDEEREEREYEERENEPLTLESLGMSIRDFM